MSVPINDDRDRLFQKRRARKAIFQSPVIEPSSRGLRVRNPRIYRVGGALALLLGCVFTGMGATVWLLGTWLFYAGGTLFVLFGLMMLVLGLLAVCYRQNAIVDATSGRLHIRYGFLVSYQRFCLDGDSAAPVLDFTRVFGITKRSGYEHALLALRHPDRDEEIALANAPFRHELMPLFRELCELLTPAALDRTLVPVELPDGRRISVSWMPTGAPRTARSDLDVKLNFPDTETARFCGTSRETTLRRRADHLEIRCEADSTALGEERWQETVPLAEIEAVQICSQFCGVAGEQHGRPDSLYELNLIGESFEDVRLSLVQMWFHRFQQTLSSTPEVRQLAESLGEFLEKPVADHAGIGREE